MLSRVQLDPDVRVMFLTPDGSLLYSSDPQDADRLGERLGPAGLSRAQQGQEAVMTNYSILRLNNVLIDVLSPVIDSRQELVGIVRVTYQIASLYELLSQFRNLIAIVLVLGLLIGAVIGSLLAVTIGRPVQRVTRAIYDVASGVSTELLPEDGPQEMRHLSRAVNHLVGRLTSLEQARRRLLANLVHELGRPLAALRSAIHPLSIR